MKYINIIKDYAQKGASLPPLKALHHITDMYMDQCGISISLRTVVYESGEFWLRRLIDSSEEWRNKLVDRDELLFHAMRHFHKDYTLEEYERYDITWLSEDARKDTIDDMVSLLCEEIDEVHGIVKPWDEEYLQAYCWGAYEYIKQFIYKNADNQ